MTVNIDYEADKKLDFDYEKIIREVINGALDFEECPYETEVNVVLTTNDEIAMINRDYRDLFKPTDVLSFPLGENGKFDKNENGAYVLGDVVISMPKAYEQADIYGHSLQREVGFLTVHSLLHLLGYDHEQGGLPAVQMREKEEIVLSRLGIPRGASYVFADEK